MSILMSILTAIKGLLQLIVRARLSIICFVVAYLETEALFTSIVLGITVIAINRIFEYHLKNLKKEQKLLTDTYVDLIKNNMEKIATVGTRLNGYVTREEFQQLIKEYTESLMTGNSKFDSTRMVPVDSGFDILPGDIDPYAEESDDIEKQIVIKIGDYVYWGETEKELQWFKVMDTYKNVILKLDGDHAIHVRDIVYYVDQNDFESILNKYHKD